MVGLERGADRRRRGDPGQRGAPRPERQADPDARGGEQEAEVVDHEQRQVDPEAGERVGPGRGADRRHRAVDHGSPRQGEGADLAGEVAAGLILVNATASGALIAAGFSLAIALLFRP